MLNSSSLWGADKRAQGEVGFQPVLRHTLMFGQNRRTSACGETGRSCYKLAQASQDSRIIEDIADFVISRSSVHGSVVAGAAGAGTPAVVITGASTGIGAASAVELARRGFRVFAGVRKDATASG